MLFLRLCFQIHVIYTKGLHMKTVHHHFCIREYFLRVFLVLQIILCPINCHFLMTFHTVKNVKMEAVLCPSITCPLIFSHQSRSFFCFVRKRQFYDQFVARMRFIYFKTSQNINLLDCLCHANLLLHVRLLYVLSQWRTRVRASRSQKTQFQTALMTMTTPWQRLAAPSGPGRSCASSSMSIT